MACGGCGKGGGNRHATKNGGDLKKFAYLTPRQLRYLKSLEPSEPDEESGSSEEQE